MVYVFRNRDRNENPFYIFLEEPLLGQEKYQKIAMDSPTFS